MTGLQSVPLFIDCQTTGNVGVWHLAEISLLANDRFAPKTGHSLAAGRIRDVHDVRHRLVNRDALTLVIERESQHLTTDLSPNNRCTHESDFNSSNPALTEKT